MLPSVVASELEQVAADAIRTAFHPTTPGFRGLIDRFLADRERLFKGPYVSVALPFQQGSGRDWFPQIPLPFPPYLHLSSDIRFWSSGDMKTGPPDGVLMVPFWGPLDLCFIGGCRFGFVVGGNL